MSILEPGQILRDTYEVERLLGEGAFAEVYRVRHRFLGRQAMKVFKKAGATLEEIEADLEEALLLSRLRHPNIVELFDANILEREAERFGYFTMTCVPGGTLDRYWRSFGPRLMPVPEVVEIGRQACRALSVAHRSSPPIVHRDVKPQNLLVGFGPEGVRVRLSDFGLAKAVHPLTLLVSAQGTLGFKPPESLENQDSPAADVWALGTTLYLLLTDEMPHPSLGDRGVADASRSLEAPRSPRIFNIDVDPELEAIVTRCLAPSPAARTPNAGALLEELEAWRPRSGAAAPAAVELRSTSRASRSASSLGSSALDLHAEARRALAEALHAARDPARLASAADLLEEAMGKDPELRKRYAHHLDLWRRGISHVSAIDLSRPARQGAGSARTSKLHPEGNRCPPLR